MKINFEYESKITEQEIERNRLSELNAYKVKAKNIDDVSISMKLYEYKGKYEAFKTMYNELKIENDKTIKSLLERIKELDFENRTLKQFKIKNEELNTKLERGIMQYNALKLQLMQFENQINQLNERANTAHIMRLNPQYLIGRENGHTKHKYKESATTLDVSSEESIYQQTLGDLNMSGMKDDIEENYHTVLKENVELKNKLFELEEIIKNSKIDSNECDSMDYRLINYID
jgi:hypothetical protein